MSLPEIPAAAVNAANKYLSGRFDGMHEAYAQGVVERVWPHLYAAALRDAADKIYGGDDQRTYIGSIRDELHTFAREATA